LHTHHEFFFRLRIFCISVFIQPNQEKNENIIKSGKRISSIGKRREINKEGRRKQRERKIYCIHSTKSNKRINSIGRGGIKGGLREGEGIKGEGENRREGKRGERGERGEREEKRIQTLYKLDKYYLFCSILRYSFHKSNGNKGDCVLVSQILLDI
jgi:hypothetical protein